MLTGCGRWGLKNNEYMLPYPSRSFEGYRLLQEYFSFPQKFLFFEVTGLRELSGAQFQDAVELIFLISRFERPEREKLLEQGISASTFRLSWHPGGESISASGRPYPTRPDALRVSCGAGCKASACPRSFLRRFCCPD